jgi:hypothetical protein
VAIIETKVAQFVIVNDEICENCNMIFHNYLFDYQILNSRSDKVNEIFKENICMNQQYFVSLQPEI